MQTAFVYHFFSQFNTVINEVEHSPILCSIASLRKHSDIPIYVIDHTPNLHDWEDYCCKLKFEVISFDCDLKIETSPFRNFFNCKYFLKKVIDIKFFFGKFERVVYCDSDIFWLKDPFPLVDGDFCTTFTNKGFYNSGYYYFKNLNFLNFWIEIINESIKYKSFRKDIFNFLHETKTHFFPNILTDETTMTFAAHHFKEKIILQKEVSIYDNNTKNLMKGIHVVSRFTKNKKKFFEHIQSGKDIEKWRDDSVRKVNYFPDCSYRPFKEML
jgi:hypothetical protein